MEIEDTKYEISRAERYIEIGRQLEERIGDISDIRLKPLVGMSQEYLRQRLDDLRQVFESQKELLKWYASREFSDELLKAYRHGITDDEVDRIRRKCVENHDHNYGIMTGIPLDQARAELSVDMVVPVSSASPLVSRYAFSVVMAALKNRNRGLYASRFDAIDAAIDSCFDEFAHTYAFEAAISLTEAREQLRKEIGKFYDSKTEEEKAMKMEEATNIREAQLAANTGECLRRTSQSDQRLADIFQELVSSGQTESEAQASIDATDPFKLYDMLAATYLD